MASADALRAIAERQQTLADVVRWGLARQPPAVVSQVVVQDEYTHDVIVPVDGLFLVYDTT